MESIDGDYLELLREASEGRDRYAGVIAEQLLAGCTREDVRSSGTLGHYVTYRDAVHDLLRGIAE